jgi:hypothetical protein
MTAVKAAGKAKAEVVQVARVAAAHPTASRAVTGRALFTAASRASTEVTPFLGSNASAHHRVGFNSSALWRRSRGRSLNLLGVEFEPTRVPGLRPLLERRIVHGF